jgi:hypothetical protein
MLLLLLLVLWWMDKTPFTDQTTQNKNIYHKDKDNEELQNIPQHQKSEQQQEGKNLVLMLN